MSDAFTIDCDEWVGLLDFGLPTIEVKVHPLSKHKDARRAN